MEIRISGEGQQVSGTAVIHAVFCGGTQNVPLQSSVAVMWRGEY